MNHAAPTRRTRPGLRRLTAALALTALLASGCAADDSAPSESASPSPSAPVTAVELPSTAAGEATTWILGEMNAETDTTLEAWEPRVNDTMREALPEADVVGIVNTQIRPARPLVATAYRETDDATLVTTIAGSLGEPFDMTVVVDDSGLIAGLLFGPVTPEREPAASLGEVDTRLSALDVDVRALVVFDGEEVISTDVDEPAPVGSVFKLYVLAAVADAVAEGTLAWDDPLEVTDDVRSLPSGELQDAPEGTVVSVREAALKMISISDNTATDMLIAAIGREGVEQSVSELGHHDPGELRPFLTTREAFALEWGGNDDLAERWSDGDEDDRRTVLGELGERPFDIDLETVDPYGDAMWTKGIEWLASASDVSNAHDALAQRAAADATVQEILGENPGIVIASGTWPVTAFKGGSSPGVVAGSWRAVDAEGRVLTVVLLASSEDGRAIAEITPELFGLAEDIFTIVGDEGAAP